MVSHCGAFPDWGPLKNQTNSGRQGTENCNVGEFSPLDLLNFLWMFRLSPGFFLQFGKSPQSVEKIARFRRILSRVWLTKNIHL